MIRYKFFQKIGAFSVDLKNSKSIISSLRYAVHSMDRPQASLFIFPEGEIVPFSTVKPRFKKGLSWIAKKCPDADIIPVGIYVQYSRYDKPELFIKIGDPVKSRTIGSNPESIEKYEVKLQEVLITLHEDSHSGENRFQKL